jgi:hypothetical protein
MKLQTTATLALLLFLLLAPPSLRVSMAGSGTSHAVTRLVDSIPLVLV